MAYESAVENLADLETTESCSGCDEKLNLLYPHLNVMIKPQRSVIETVDAALVGAETDEDGAIVKLAMDVTKVQDELTASRDRFYIGVKSGEGHMAKFHNYSCLAEFSAEKAEDTKHQVGDAPKIRLMKVDPEAEGRGTEDAPDA